MCYEISDRKLLKNKAYNWGTDVCWVAPPPYLIAKVLIHAESNKAKGICFIPKWEAAIFWPIVIKLINNKKITLIHEFVRPCKLFIKGSLLNKIFTEETCSFNMLVFKFRLIFYTLLILITYCGNKWFHKYITLFAECRHLSSLGTDTRERERVWVAGRSVAAGEQSLTVISKR